ncbi:hypothetical protein ACWKWP_05905 [Agromyces soli]
MTSFEYGLDVGRLAMAADPYLDRIRGLDLPETTSGVWVLDLHIQTATLRDQTAVLHVVQLAVDAASLAILATELYRDSAGLEVVDRPLVTLNVLWVAPGSLRISTIIDPTTSAGRHKIRNIVYGMCTILGFTPAAPLAAAFLHALEMMLYQEEKRAEQQADQERRDMRREIDALRATVEEIRYALPVELKTTDDDAIQRARATVRLTPPGIPWTPPK